jgi:hypothetical protein
MPHHNSHSYEFGPYRLDVGQRVLARTGEAVSLTPKATEILTLLVANAGQLVGNLVGKLTSQPDSLGITVELVEVRTGWQPWGDSFDCRLKNVLEAQDCITRQLLNAAAERCGDREGVKRALVSLFEEMNERLNHDELRQVFEKLERVRNVSEPLIGRVEETIGQIGSMLKSDKN